MLVKLPWVFRDDRFKEETAECAARADIGGIATWARLLAPLPTSPRLAVSTTVDDVAAHKDIPAIDCGHVFDSVALDDRVKLFRDAIHATPEGYREIARCIGEALRPTVAGVAQARTPPD